MADRSTLTSHLISHRVQARTGCYLVLPRANRGSAKHCVKPPTESIRRILLCQTSSISWSLAVRYCQLRFPREAT